MRCRLVKLLEDVQSAGSAIQAYTAGMGEDDYLAAQQTRRAVEREFQIIGEAIRRITIEFQSVVQRITSASQIVSFRNVLTHGYDAVAGDVVWSIEERRRPQLLAEVRQLIAEEEGPG